MEECKTNLWHHNIRVLMLSWIFCDGSFGNYISNCGSDRLTHVRMKAVGLGDVKKCQKTFRSGSISMYRAIFAIWGGQKWHNEMIWWYFVEIWVCHRALRYNMLPKENEKAVLKLWLIKIQGAELNIRGEIEPANHLLCPHTKTSFEISWKSKYLFWNTFVWFSAGFYWEHKRKIKHWGGKWISEPFITFTH